MHAVAVGTHEMIEAEIRGSIELSWGKGMGHLGQFERQSGRCFAAAAPSANRYVHWRRNWEQQAVASRAIGRRRQSAEK